MELSLQSFSLRKQWLLVPNRLEEVEPALLACTSMECRQPSERLGIEFNDLLCLLGSLLLLESLLLWRLVRWMKELVLRIKETDEDEVEVLVGFLLD